MLDAFNDVTRILRYLPTRILGF